MQRQACHLVRGLRARRDKSAFRTCTRCAVTDGENVRIARGLQRRLDHQLVNAVSFQPADLFHEIRRFDASRPDHQVSLNILAAFGVQTAFISAGDHSLGQNTHAHFGQLVVRSTGNAWWQCRQNALARFDQRHVQRFVGQPFVAVAVQLFYRVVQFRRKLHARRPAADNRDVHFAAGTEVVGVFQEQVQHFLVETTRLMRVIQEDAVFFHAWGVEVV
ncbi:hypothetical protein D3C85_1276620 [compost metagenome]